MRRAKAAGLAAIALTDHDTTDGVAEAMRAGETLAIRAVPGGRGGWAGSAAPEPLAGRRAAAHAHRAASRARHQRRVGLARRYRARGRAHDARRPRRAARVVGTARTASRQGVARSRLGEP